MRIIDAYDRPNIKFAFLKDGDLFQADGYVYMKIPECYQLNTDGSLTLSADVPSPCRRNAVNLETGKVYDFTGSRTVTKIVSSHLELH